MEKLPSSNCKALPSLAWLRKDRLKSSNLRDAFSRLLEREKKEWKPLFFSPTESKDEVSPSDRLKALSRQWRTAMLLHWGTETRFCAASILDTLLRKVRVTPKLLPAVADTALLIAAKIMEEDERIGFLSEVLDIGEMKLGLQELVRMERILLDKLQWDPKASLSLEMLQTTHALCLATSGPTIPHSPTLGSSYANSYHRFRFGSTSASEELSLLTKYLWDVIQQVSSTSIRPSVLALTLVTSGGSREECQHLWCGNEKLFAWLLSAIRINPNDFFHTRRLVGEIVHCHSRPSPSDQKNHRFEDCFAENTMVKFEGRTLEHSTCNSPLSANVEQVNHSEKRRGTLFDQDTKENSSSFLSDPKLAEFQAVSLHSPPPSLRPTLRPLQNIGRLIDSKKRRRRKCGFRAKGNIRGLIRSSLKISSKISVIHKVVSEVSLADFPYQENEEGYENGIRKESLLPPQDRCHPQGSKGDSIAISVQQSFSPTSPHFPGIIQGHESRSQNIQRDKKMDVCKEEEKRSAVCRPLTYAQVLRLHLAPLKQVLVA